METRKTILLFVFLFSVFILWENWQKINGQPTLFSGSQQAQSPSLLDKKQDSSPVDLPVIDKEQSLAPTLSQTASSYANESFTIETDVLRLIVSPVGAQIIRAELLNHPDAELPDQPVKLFDYKDRYYVGQMGWIGFNHAPNHRSVYQLKSSNLMMKPNTSEISVVFESRTEVGISTITYNLTRGRYDISVSQSLVNLSDSTINPFIYSQLVRDASKSPGESSLYSTFTGPAAYTEAMKYKKIAFSDLDKSPFLFEKSLETGWVAMVQHYFVAAIIHPENIVREFFAKKIDANRYAVGTTVNLGALEAGKKTEYKWTLFLGPQEERLLEKISQGFELVRDYGWLTIISKPLFWLLEHLHLLTNNWGWSIVLLTVIVKLAFFPLSAASYRSMARMKLLTPKLLQIKEQYAQDKMAMNQAMMELYRKEKINPLGGCLPILVQIPVFLALYWVLLASVEMRNAPWIGWIKDLAVPDPFYVLPVLMAITMFLQTRLNPTPPDPVQAKVMLIMPLMFSFMFIFFPSGLVLYWVVNNILSIAQQWTISRTISGVK